MALTHPQPPPAPTRGEGGGKVACCLFARRIFMFVPAVGGAGSQPARHPAETGVGCALVQSHHAGRWLALQGKLHGSTIASSEWGDARRCHFASASSVHRM